jgi:hypothetical protein
MTGEEICAGRGHPVNKRQRFAGAEPPRTGSVFKGASVFAKEIVNRIADPPGIWRVRVE